MENIQKKILLFTTIFCYTTTLCMLDVKDLLVVEIVSSQEKPHIVAWLKGNEIFIGGKTGFEIIDLNTQEVITQSKRIECISDIALNTSRTLYAISTTQTVNCYNTQTHESIWPSIHGYNTFTPVTFNSQNENQLITSSTASYSPISPFTITEDSLLTFFVKVLAFYHAIPMKQK